MQFMKKTCAPFSRATSWVTAAATAAEGASMSAEKASFSAVLLMQGRYSTSDSYKLDL